MHTDLTGTYTLVTGASGGIGQATSRLFGREGSHLVLHYHRNLRGVEAVAQELPFPGLRIGADLTDEVQVDALFRQALESFPRLDAVVVNAGIWVEEAVPLHRLSLEQWRKTLDVDLTSAFLTCRAFLRHLADVPRQSASIVLVASTAGLFGEEGHSDYAAAKSGMAYGLTLSLKNEIVRLAPRGRVNCVCPGWVDTPMAARAMADPGAVERATSTMALRKIAGAQDVASAVVFLSSERLAGHLSGSILPIAGGMEGRRLHP